MADQLTATQKKILNFMNFIGSAAIAAGNTYKINPVFIIAQAGVESGWGASSLCKETKNYFNITRGSWQGPTVTRMVDEYINNKWTKVPVQFRKYNSITEGVNNACDLIARAYIEHGDYTAVETLDAYAKALTGGNKGGRKFGTDPNYAKKFKVAASEVIGLVKFFNPQSAGVGGGMLALLFFALPFILRSLK